MSKQERTRRILVVDDEPQARDVLSEMLDALGFETGTAADSQEAIGKLRHESFDLVLTDFFMPGMNGLELVREIKTMIPDMPVLVITAHSSVQTAVESVRAGAFDYIEKPVSLDALQMRVQRALEYADLVASSAEYKRRATVDALTGLYNFGYFQEHIEREVQRARRYSYPLSVLMIDMDHLKVYNDAHGHTAGNRVLIQLGELLRASIRKADVACRFGGEEFAVILPHTGKKDAYLLCDRLRTIVEETHFDGEEVLPKGKLTVSSGVATFPDDADGAEELVERADRALYGAKRNGRNLVETYNG
jgi:diguanylate cyclase (GGDEF)-like protein